MKNAAWNIGDAVVERGICSNDGRAKAKRSDQSVFRNVMRNHFQMSWTFRVPDAMIRAQIVFALSH